MNRVVDANRQQTKIRPRLGRLATPTLLSGLLLLPAMGCSPEDEEDDGQVDLDGTEPDEVPDAGRWPQYRLEPTHAGVAPQGTRVGPDLELQA